MGLGRLLTRSTVITSTNTVTGETATFTVVDNLAPDWPSSDAYRGAMSIPGAWRAATLLAGLLAQVPWNAYREHIGGPDEIIQPRPPLLEQPNPPRTRFTTFSSFMLDYLWHGNAVGVWAARNRQGWPTAVIPVPAQSVSVRQVTPYVDSPLPVGELEYSIGKLRLGASDVMHIMGPVAPGGVRGMGRLEAHMATLTLADEQGRQARSISRSGVPTGILTTTNPDTTPEEMSASKTAWLAAQRDRTIAALSPSTDFKPIAWNPEELELVEARKFTLTELELIFGLPVGWLGGQTSSRTYSNIEQDAVNLLKFSLGDHLAQFEQTLSLAFPRGTCARATLDAFLRPDTLTRYQAHALALGNKPWKTVNEVRELENLPPDDELDSPEPAPPVQAQAVVGQPAPPAIEGGTDNAY